MHAHHKNKKGATFSKYAVHRKVWIDWNIVCGIIFRRCRQTQLSSTAGFGNEMKLKLRLPPFALIHILCQRSFCFQFRSLLPLSKFWYICMYTHWQTMHIGSFLIPCLRSCPVLIDLKLLLSSLARYAISGQFDRKPNCPFQTGLDLISNIN